MSCIQLLNGLSSYINPLFLHTGFRSKENMQDSSTKIIYKKTKQNLIRIVLAI